MVTHAAPRPFQIDRAGAVSVSVSTLKGERATDFLSQITNQFFDEIRHLLEISIGPIGLEHREFRIVFSRDAFVAKVTIDFEHLVESAHQQTFQIKLQSNAQIKIDAKCVVTCFEWFGRCTSSHRL